MNNFPKTALSIRQPWAWLIVHGFKNIENRTWKYPPKFLGEFLIHASSGMTRDEYDDVEHFLVGSNVELPPYENLERGGIVGMANLVDVVKESKSPWFFGELGFVLEGMKPLPFMQCKGQLGFFDVEYQGQG